MIIYNITFNVNYPVETDWLTYIKQTHIPEILATELPLDVKLLRLLTEIENEGSTYTTQYSFLTMEDFLTYQTLHHDRFQQKHHQMFKGQYVSFQTLLEEA